MKRIFLLTLFGWLAVALSGNAGQQASSQALILVHVTVIDATGAPPQPDMTVVITGNRISALGKTGKVKIPKEAQVIDATGKYLIPGLWDMHVHLGDENIFFPLLIANGVTGIREMFTGLPVEQIARWRESIQRGALVGPRIVMPGPAAVDGLQSLDSRCLRVAGESEARAAISSLKQQGADFIKVFTFIPRDAFFALADEAKKQMIVFAGHVPVSVSAAEASDAGMKSMEHLIGVLPGCSTLEAELMAETIKIADRTDLAPPARLRRLAFPPAQKLLDTYNAEKAASLFRRFVNNDTWQVPTLIFFRGWAFIADSTLANDERLNYIPASSKASWNPAKNFLLSDLNKEELTSLCDNEKILFQKYLEVIGEMRRAGVMLMAGTDVSGWNPYVYPGFSLHDELALFVKAGLTPMEALQTATCNPAKFLGMIDSLGTVEKGKIADLVLLEANPLADINNTKSIAAVVFNGKLFHKPALQEMLANIEKIAK